MPGMINCATCGTALDVDQTIEVDDKYYCDKYCLYVDQPDSPFINAPQETREQFARVARAKAAFRTASAELQKARV